jgi:hypothetical protein
MPKLIGRSFNNIRKMFVPGIWRNSNKILNGVEEPCVVEDSGGGSQSRGG